MALTYQKYTVTSAGVSIDPNTGFDGQFFNPLIYAASPVTLAGNIAINSTLPSVPTFYSVRWEMAATLGSFSVTIESNVIAQDCVNQPGTFSVYYDGAAWTVQYWPDFVEKPQANYGVQLRAVPTSGALAVTPGVDKQWQVFTGLPTTLLGNYAVTVAVGVKAGSTMYLEVGGSVTATGGDLVFQGITIPKTLASTGGAVVECYYNSDGGGSYRAILVNKEVALANLAQQAALTVLVNATNATDYVQALAFTNEGDVLQRIGNALITGPLTAASFGGSTLLPQISTLNIPSADIQKLNTTPLDLLPAPAAGYLHQPICWIVETAVGSPNVTYDTSLTLEFYFPGAPSNLLTSGAPLLGFTTASTAYLFPANPADFNVLTAQPLRISSPADPQTGTGSIKVTTVYNVIPPR